MYSSVLRSEASKNYLAFTEKVGVGWLHPKSATFFPKKFLKVGGTGGCPTLHSNFWTTETSILFLFLALFSLILAPFGQFWTLFGSKTLFLALVGDFFLAMHWESYW